MAMHDEALRTFVVGLKNAHAMEKQALSIMKPQLSRIANYPEIADRLRKHIGETEMQLKRVDTILNDLRERHSAVKDMMLSVGGSMASLSHVITGDEILKNTFANYAFEHYEIAAYTSLSALCETLSQPDAAHLIEQSLEEERAMAAWIEDHIVPTTRRFVQLEASEATANI